MSTSAAPTPPRRPIAARRVLERLAGGTDGPPPVWLMRQAGRYLPEYREVRTTARGFLDLCYTPALATEVTLQPIRRFGFDAAILFSDILVVPDALGVPVRFLEGEGPQLEPVRNAADVARLDPGRIRSHLAPVFETVRRLAVELPPEVTLLGFAGSPWTVAAYMVEGHGSREYLAARQLARAEPGLFAALIDCVTEATIDYLCAQIEAGADAVQLFDSWAAVLPPNELERWSVAPARRIVSALAARHPTVPVILFPRGVGGNLSRFAGLGAAGLSLDTGVPMAWAAGALPDGCALQGNLDPVALLGPVDTLLAEAAGIVRAAAGRPHIFNLGHGILPTTPPDHVRLLVEYLKSVGG